MKQMKHIKLLEDFLNEGAFHVALYKARNEGAKEFEFKGQKFPVHPKKGEPEMIDEEDEKIEEGVVSIKGGRILAHKVLNKLVDMDILPVKKKTEEAIEAIASVLATTSMSESLNEGYEVHYSDGVRAMKKFGSESQAVSYAKDLIKNKKGLQNVEVFNAGSDFHSTADTDAVVAWWGDGSFMDNKSKNDPKLAAKKIDESIDIKYWADYNTDTSGQSDPEFANKSKDFEGTFKEAVKDWNDMGEDPITNQEAEKAKKIAKEFFNKAGWISVNVAHAIIAQES